MPSESIEGTGGYWGVHFYIGGNFDCPMQPRALRAVFPSRPVTSAQRSKGGLPVLRQQR